VNEIRNEPVYPAIAGYTVEGFVDRGGMGSVWRARQVGTNRVVAVKKIHAAGAPTPAALARFLLEAELLARVRHPNIVQIFHTGEADGPYLVMEYVPGGTLADRMARRKYTPREAAELVKTLAEAMGAVHRTGVVHRDLKPANVLMTEDDVPKIGDFGLARAPDRGMSGLDRAKILGTVEYMSPEQARGGGPLREVAAPTDVYALGVILYELLTGGVPFESDSDLEALNLVCSAEPRRPGMLRPGIPRDLEAICLKCLAKEPRERYSDGTALADDLGRFLRLETIVARRVGPSRRLARWCRRNPLVAALIASAVVGSSLLVAVRLESDRRRLAELSLTAETARTETEAARATAALSAAAAARKLAAERQVRVDENTYFNTVADAAREYRNGNLDGAKAVMDRYRPTPGQPDLRNWEWNYLRRLVACDLLRVSFTPRRYLDEPARLPLAFAPDGKRIRISPGCEVELEGLLPGSFREVRFRPGKADLNAGRINGSLPIAIREDGSSAAVGQADGVFLYEARPAGAAADAPPYVKARPLEGFAVGAKDPGTQPRKPPTFAERIEPTAPTASSATGTKDLRFSPDGQRIAALVVDGTVRAWDVASGRELGRIVLTPPGDTSIERGSIALTPDGGTVAILYWRDAGAGRGLEHTLAVWDVNQRELRFSRVVESIPALPIAVQTPGSGVAFSPDGQQVAFDSANAFRSVVIVDARNGRELAEFLDHPCWNRVLRFSPDGTRLASGGSDGFVAVWQLAPVTGVCEVKFRAHLGEIKAIAYSPDGRQLATSDDVEIRVRDTRNLPGIVRVNRSSALRRGETLAAYSADMTALWDDFSISSRSIPRVALPGSPAPERLDIGVFSRDGQRVAAASGRVVHAWDVSGRSHLGTFTRHRDAIRSLAFSGDGSQIASVGWASASLGAPGRGEVWIWNTTTGAPAFDSPIDLARQGFDLRTVPRAVFHPDPLRNMVVILGLAAEDEGELKSIAMAFDTRTGQRTRVESGVQDLAFDTSGRLAARVFADGRLEVTDASSGRPVSSMSVPMPSGRPTNSSMPRLFAQPLADEAPPGPSYRLCFSADGTRLMTLQANQAASKPGDSPPNLRVALFDPIRGREALAFSELDPDNTLFDNTVFTHAGHLLVYPNGLGLKVWNGAPLPGHPAGLP